MKESIDKIFDDFKSLNPLLLEEIKPALNKLAKDCPEDQHDYIFDQASQLIEYYLKSPIKLSEKNTLSNYYKQLETTSKKMISAGKVNVLDQADQSSSLIPANYFAAHDWIKLQIESNLSANIITAVDAIRERHNSVDSVLESLFIFLLKLNEDKALAWQLALCDEAVDPDISRDLMRCWRTFYSGSVMPAASVEILARWSEDELIYRHWPTVSKEADQLIRLQSLMQLYHSSAKFRLTGKLRSLYPFTNNEDLLDWYIEAIHQLGESVDFFSNAVLELQSNETVDERRQNAIFMELKWISQITPLLMNMSDMLLNRPDGALTFAMSIFGFSPSYKEKWFDILVHYSSIAVRKCFLRDLRYNRSTMETIKVLSFGDEHIQKRIHEEIDLLHEQFDSIKQREIAVNILAHVYADYRKDGLIAQEIARRYRRLMRVLHEDLLNQVLSKEHLKELEPMRETLLDFSVIASESRKYLGSRRALEKSTEELMATEMDYTQHVRKMRSRYFRKINRNK
ncbi:MAG: hypothetical protein HRT89_19790 [Lentisphaeria bacterium]|nr:hypothetical protein [Lentisphaeria bacterium]NQZ70300.1 hypothetical protein [Lentisphaeria bacterium]